MDTCILKYTYVQLYGCMCYCVQTSPKLDSVIRRAFDPEKPSGNVAPVHV